MEQRNILKEICEEAGVNYFDMSNEEVSKANELPDVIELTDGKNRIIENKLPDDEPNRCKATASNGMRCHNNADIDSPFCIPHKNVMASRDF